MKMQRKQCNRQTPFDNTSAQSPILRTAFVAITTDKTKFFSSVLRKQFAHHTNKE